MVGDVVELHCEAQRGSPPILYQFYHEDVTLGSSSSASGGGASFNLVLKTEHSGNYFCEANNGQGVQRSYTVSLSVRGKWTQLQHNQRQTISPTFPSSRELPQGHLLWDIIASLLSTQPPSESSVFYIFRNLSLAFACFASPGSNTAAILTQSILM